MKTRQRVRKADDATAATPTTTAAATHRLTDISVEEISIVDRAANKRKYLMVKNADGTTDVVKTGVAKDGPPPAPQAPAPPQPPTTPAPATLTISPELKAQVLGILKAAQEQIGVISKVLEGSSETPGAAPPKELMDALAQLAKTLTPPTTAAPATPPAPAPHAAPPAAPPAIGKVDAEKAGKKISASTLAQLTAAHTTIGSLIAEAQAPETTDPTTETAAPPATPPADPAEKATPQPPAAPPVAAPAVAPELQKQIETMADTVNKMAVLFQAQAKQLEDLRKSRGSSQQADLDGADVKKKSEVVSWPLDMARRTAPIQ